MSATLAFTACAPERGESTNPNTYEMSMDAGNSIVIKPGEIKRIPKDETGAEINDTTFLSEFISQRESISAGGILTPDEETITRIFDGDTITDGVYHAHTTNQATCLEFEFDTPIESAELLADSDGFGAQLSLSGLDLIICKEKPKGEQGVAIRINRTEE